MFASRSEKPRSGWGKELCIAINMTYPYNQTIGNASHSTDP